MIKLNFFSIVFFVSMLSTNFSFAQKTDGNKELQKITNEVKKNGWAYYKSNANVKPSNAFTKHKKAYGLTDNDEMRHVKSQSDNLNENKHERYQQYYKGIKIEGAQYILHTKNDIVEYSNGKLVKELNANTKPAIKEEIALKTALKAINATTYAWEDEDLEKQTQLDRNDEQATNYPNGELVFVRLPESESFSPENLRLAYKFEIRCLQPFEHHMVYIDAQNGNFIKEYNTLQRENGTVYTPYDGSFSFETEWQIWPLSRYILKANDAYNEIKTRKWDASSWAGCSNFTQSSNTWTNTAAYSRDCAGPTSHGLTQRAYKYFQYRHQKAGVGEEIRIAVKDDATTGVHRYDGASWIYVGHYTANNLYTISADAIGHEYAHLIAWHMSDLISQGATDRTETGGLAESFSDIFGVMIDKYMHSNDWNWLIGEDFYTGGLRDMSDPKVDTYGDSYTGSSWTNLIAHVKSGPQNKWFYLLSEGGSQNGVTVSGIGTYDAARIAYSNMAYHMTSSSDYDDAREGSVNAAHSIFGECSNQHIQTMNAWAAVGVGDPAPNPCGYNISAYITGPIEVEMDYYYTWYIQSYGGPAGGYSYTWYWKYDYDINTWQYGGTGSSFTYSPVFYDAGDLHLKCEVVNGSASTTAYYDAEVFNPYSSGSINISDAEHSNNVKISPNPATDYINLHVNDLALGENNSKIYNLRIFNSVGQLVFENTLSKSTSKINISDLPKGVYKLQVVVNGKKNITETIIKY